MLTPRSKWLLILYGSVIVFLTLFLISYLLLFTFSHESLNPLQVRIKDGIVQKWEKTIKRQPEDQWVLTDYSYLLSNLNSLERMFVEALFSQNPALFGLEESYHQSASEPNLVKIVGQKAEIGIIYIDISPQYVPRCMYQDLVLLQQNMQKEMGSSVLVLAGWRSFGYQAYLFLSQLGRFENSLSQTVRYASWPGYSEHQNLDQPAVDFITKRGIAGDDFGKSDEYKWLLKNAYRYNFFMSYRRGGWHQFEPWHWHWKEKQR